MTPEEIQELYNDLGRPTAAKFARALRKRGITAAGEDLGSIKLQVDRQLRAPSPRYKGKIVSP